MTSPMTDSTPLVEKVARAIYAQAPDIRMMNSIQSTLSWDETGEWMREQCRRQARAALDASGNDERLLRLAWLLRRNLEDEDRRMAVENCNRLICLIETGETPDDMDTLRAVYRTISARLADGSAESGGSATSERVALLDSAAIAPTQEPEQ